MRKRKNPRALFVTPRKGTQLKKPRNSSPGPSPIFDPIESPCSDDTMFESTSASQTLGTHFLNKEEKRHSVITVRSPDLREKVVIVTEVRSNLVIDIDILQSLFSKFAICKSCKLGNLVIWDKGGKSCFAYYLTLRCDRCGCGKDIWTVSGKFGTKIDINDRKVSKRNDSIYQSILGGRLVGLGRRGLSLYHAMLGIGQPPAYFPITQEDLLVAVEFVAKGSMERAAIELEATHGRAEDGLIHDIASFDGAYQKRSTKGGGGYSRYCFGSVVSMSLGKILEYEVACNSCRECTRIENMFEGDRIDREEYDILVDSHQSICPAKYSEFASVCLESELSIVILEQALGRGIVFDGLVCDGDIKTFAKVTEDNPYANKAQLHRVARYECLAHVGKRMKGHLIDHQKDQLKQARIEKQSERTKILQLGQSAKTVDKDLGFRYRGKLQRRTLPRGDWGTIPEVPTPTSSASKRGRKAKVVEESIEVKFLSDEMCSRITSFYQLAVKQHLGNPGAILEAIKAIPLHLGANRDNASVNHSLCPRGVDSWCRYQRAIAEGNTPPRHPNFLGTGALEIVTRVFSKYNYDKDYFISQIASGQTSNHNEAVHNILFTMVRKTDAIGMGVMRLGSALAVIRYNEGYRTILQVLELLQVKIHPGLIELWSELDKVRVKSSYKLPEKQQAGFASRMKRHRKTSASLSRCGKSYESGKYSAAVVGNPDGEDEGDRVDPVVPTSSKDVEVCGSCGRGESDGILHELIIIVDSDVLEWVCCDSCNVWFHCVCIGLGE